MNREVMYPETSDKIPALRLSMTEPSLLLFLTLRKGSWHRFRKNLSGTSVYYPFDIIRKDAFCPFILNDFFFFFDWPYLIWNFVVSFFCALFWNIKPEKNYGKNYPIYTISLGMIFWSFCPGFFFFFFFFFFKFFFLVFLIIYVLWQHCEYFRNFEQEELVTKPA